MPVSTLVCFAFETGCNVHSNAMLSSAMLARLTGARNDDNTVRPS